MSTSFLGKDKQAIKKNVSGLFAIGILFIVAVAVISVKTYLDSNTGLFAADSYGN